MSLKAVIHNLSLVLLGFVFVSSLGCGKIDDVKTSGGGCTDEFKTAYNALNAEFVKLDALTLDADRDAKGDEIENQCEVFFKDFAADVECKATRDEKEVTVKAADFRVMCDAPEFYVTRQDPPEPLD